MHASASTRFSPRARRAEPSPLDSRAPRRSSSRRAEQPGGGGYDSRVALRVWSVYGALRSLAGASGGKSSTAENGLNKPSLLPLLATSCRSERMVRRGSTVRVRQRASQKASKWPFLLPRSRNTRRSRVPQPVPKICPQHLRRPGVLARAKTCDSSSTSLEGRGSIVPVGRFSDRLGSAARKTECKGRVVRLDRGAGR